MIQDKARARHIYITALKIVQERLGHASIRLTLDTYSHVASGLQEAAAKGFDDVVLPKCEREAVEKH